MDVTFHRTGPRRYAIDVRRERFPDVRMDPAPGFDPDLPHDMVHFIVEAELGLSHGVFGQLANGGDAGSFRRYPSAPDARKEAGRQRRKDRKRGGRLSLEGHGDAVLSERAAVICEHAWSVRSKDPERRNRGRDITPYAERLLEECSPAERALFSEEALARICRRFDEVCAEWRALDVGESMTLVWKG